MIARLSRRARSESGATLIELTVVMLVLGIVMAFVLQSVASYERAATGGIRRLENLDEARVLMDVMSKDIRTAAKLDATSSPFLLANNFELKFYANLNMTSVCPKRIRLYVNANKEIVEAVTQPTGGTPPNCTYPNPENPVQRLVGQYIANNLADSSQAIFTYWYDDGTGNLVQFPSSAVPLSAANQLLVKAIGINLAIRKSTALPVAVTTLVNRVRLPNVFYNPSPTPTP